MTAAEMTMFAKEWIEAFNAHGVERILSHYADDIVLTSPFVRPRLNYPDGILSGKEALKQYFAPIGNKDFKLRFTFLSCYFGVRSLALVYDRHDGLRGAEMMEFDGDGRIFRVAAHYVDPSMQDQMQDQGSLQ